MVVVTFEIIFASFKVFPFGGQCILNASLGQISYYMSLKSDHVLCDLDLCPKVKCVGKEDSSSMVSFFGGQYILNAYLAHTTCYRSLKIEKIPFDINL